MQICRRQVIIVYLKHLDVRCLALAFDYALGTKQLRYLKVMYMYSMTLEDKLIGALSYSSSFLCPVASCPSPPPHTRSR